MAMKLLKFPNDITTSTKYGYNYMLFNIAVQKSSSFAGDLVGNNKIMDANGKLVDRLPESNSGKTSNRIGGTAVSTETSIALPIPDSIYSNFGVEWAASDLGLIGSGFSSLLGDGDGPIYSGKEIGNSLGLSGVGSATAAASGLASGLVNTLAKLAGGKTAEGIASLLTGKIAEGGAAAADVLSKIALLRLGSAVNPYQELFFQRVNYRTFSFNFKLVAVSEKESDSINNIISAFKFHMHPEVSSRAARFYTLPSEFDINFKIFGEEGSYDNLYLDFISTCVLKDMTVNWSGGGPFLTHRNGQPHTVELSLQFQETEILTKNRIQEIEDKRNKAIIGRIAGEYDPSILSSISTIDTITGE